MTKLAFAGGSAVSKAQEFLNEIHRESRIESYVHKIMIHAKKF